MNNIDLEDLKRMTDAMIPNAMAAKVLKMDPGRLAQYARDGKLEWNVFAPKDGSRVYHSREDFIRFWSRGPQNLPPDPPEKTVSELLEGILEQLKEHNRIQMSMMSIGQRFVYEEMYQKSASAATPTL